MGVLRFEEVDIIGLNENEYLNIIYNWNREMTNEVDPDCRRQYASNLKIGGLRLGQSVLFVSKSKNVYRISLISSNK